MAGPTRACTRSSMCVSVSCFYGTPECENGQLSDSCVFSWALFFLLLCLVQLFPFYLTVFYFVMFCCCLLEAHSFLMRDRKGVDLDGRGGGEELGGRREETPVRIYHVREKSLFLIKGVCG